MVDEEELQRKLMELTQEHRDLDAAIDALSAQPPFDQIQIQRLKKRKLQLRDLILKINSQLLPDIIA